MDVDRFDAVIRGLTGNQSRRGSLAIVLGSGLGLWGLTEPAIAKRNKKRKKQKRKKRRGETQPPPPPPTTTADQSQRLHDYQL